MRWVDELKKTVFLLKESQLIKVEGTRGLQKSPFGIHQNNQARITHGYWHKAATESTVFPPL
jgi:hypothetical protein